MSEGRLVGPAPAEVARLPRRRPTRRPAAEQGAPQPWPVGAAPRREEAETGRRRRSPPRPSPPRGLHRVAAPSSTTVSCSSRVRPSAIRRERGREPLPHNLPPRPRPRARERDRPRPVEPVVGPLDAHQGVAPDALHAERAPEDRGRLPASARPAASIGAARTSRTCR